MSEQEQVEDLVIEPIVKPLDIDKLRKLYVPKERADFKGRYKLNGVDFSGISMWLNCGRQYYFRHIQGKKMPPGIAIAEGVGHHSAMEANNKGKIEGHPDLNAEDMTSIFVEKFRKIVPEFEREHDRLGRTFDWEGEDEDDIISRARILHKQYREEFAPKIVPVKAEASFRVRLKWGGKKFKIFGQVDLLTPSGVRDYKVSGKAKTEMDVRNSLQLALYSAVEDVSNAGFINFVKTKHPYVQEIALPFNESQKRWAYKVMFQAVVAIRRGVFPLTSPSNYLCNPRFCGYWSICRGKELTK